MKRLAMIILGLVIVGVAPAFAAEEPEEPTPTIGGPLITIPIDAGQVSELVITDVVLDPVADVAAGDVVRLTGRLAPGTNPDRIVVVIDGFREVVGNVEAAPDGAVDHQIDLPADLPPGQYALSLRADGLGIAPLGVIDVAAAAPATEAPADTQAPTTSEPGQPEAAGAGTTAVPAGDRSGRPDPPWVRIAGNAAGGRRAGGRRRRFGRACRVVATTETGGGAHRRLDRIADRHAGAGKGGRATVPRGDNVARVRTVDRPAFCRTN